MTEKTLGWHNCEDQRKTQLNANEWVDSIDLKVVSHKLLSKSSYLLPEAITGSNLHAGKNRKDETFSSQNTIIQSPRDIMFAPTTLKNFTVHVIISLHEKYRKNTFLTIQYDEYRHEVYSVQYNSIVRQSCYVEDTADHKIIKLSLFAFVIFHHLHKRHKTGCVTVLRGRLHTKRHS